MCEIDSVALRDALWVTLRLIPKLVRSKRRCPPGWARLQSSAVLLFLSPTSFRPPRLCLQRHECLQFDINTASANRGTKTTDMGGAEAGTQAFYDAALQRRQALMGASGPRALVKNFKVFSIAAFACIGGVLYGYNQGMFSGVLAMPSFQQRRCTIGTVMSRHRALSRALYRHGRV